MMDAKANISALVPQYRSKIEEDFATFGPIYLADHFGERVQVMMYEPFRLKIPGGHYTPDWLAILQSGTVVIVESKGSKRQKNYRDARTKLRAVAEHFPFFTFVEAIGKGQAWTLEVL